MDPRPSLTRALADRFRIEGELGQGGLGTVYLARDLKHDRLVALKALHGEAVSPDVSARFAREIRIAANLAHPNIVPVYDSGSAEGVLYYVMPVVEGESLRERLRSGVPLTPPEALRIVRDVARALAFAHSRGVIHRDIKPENIMLSHGAGLVTDFGLAKALDAVDGAALTQPGIAIGTLAYMSPEQLAGARELDGRSDVYSLGAVLYELITGQPAHPMGAPPDGSGGPALPRMWGSAPTPAAVRAVLGRALAPSPARRYRTARELEEALERALRDPDSPGPRRRLLPAVPPLWLVPPALVLLVPVVFGLMSLRDGDAPAAEPGGIAVLYFDDGSPDGSLGWLAEGLTEDLIDALAARGLTVAARGEARAFADVPWSADSIGRALGAALLVDGAVEPAAASGRVRASVRLLDARDGAELDRVIVESAGGERSELRARLGADLEERLRGALAAPRP